MTDVPRRTLLASAWAAPVLVAVVAAPAATASNEPRPAGTLNVIYRFSQLPGSVSWTYNVTNTSGLDVPLTVTWSLGRLIINAWLGAATWDRSGSTFSTKNAIPAGATTSNTTIMFANPPGTIAPVTITVTAPGATTTSWPDTVSIPL